MNWLDAGIIVLAIVFVWLGVRRGLMNSVLSHFTFGTNCFLSFFAVKPVSWVLDKIFNISGLISASYGEKLLSASADFGTNLLTISGDNLSSFVSETINKSGFSGMTNGLLNLFINKSTLYAELHESSLTSRNLSEIVSNGISSFFLKIISFAVCIALIYLIVWIFGLVVKKLRSVGFVKGVDNTLGSVYGLFRFLIILIIISVIVKLLSPLSFMNGTVNYINGSLFGKFIYSQVNSFLDNYLNFSDIIRAIVNK